MIQLASGAWKKIDKNFLAFISRDASLSTPHCPIPISGAHKSRKKSSDLLLKSQIFGTQGSKFYAVRHECVPFRRSEPPKRYFSGPRGDIRAERRCRARGNYGGEKELNGKSAERNQINLHSINVHAMFRRRKEKDEDKKCF